MEVYGESTQRADVEVSETQDTGRKLPTKGMQIHAEYTLYGHFFYLKKLFGGVEKLRFFLDQDSGMQAACLAAFQPEIAARRADAFYVRIAKDMSIAEKRTAIALSRAILNEARQVHPYLMDAELETLLIKERIARMATLGNFDESVRRVIYNCTLTLKINGGRRPPFIAHLYGTVRPCSGFLFRSV